MRQSLSSRAGAPLVMAALACWAMCPGAFAQVSDGEGVELYNGPIYTIQPVRICRIFAGGVRGPWIDYVATEGTATCLGRGFDTMEPALSTNDPCGVCVPVTGGIDCRPVNGAAEGGADPFCDLDAPNPALEAAGCPVGCPTCAPAFLSSRRFLSTAGTPASSANFSTGSAAHPMNPPAYAVGQNICAINGMFTTRAAAGAADAGVPANIVGNTFMDIVWHTTFNPVDCATAVQPLLGAFEAGVGLDFGPIATAPAFFRFGPIDATTLVPPLVMPGTGRAYEVLFWNDAAGTIVSGNNQPGQWGIKDTALQGSSGLTRFRNINFSAVTNDTGGQYDLPGECVTLTTTPCPRPLFASIRLGVPLGASMPVNIASANPPTAAGNGGVPYRDVLENTNASLVTEGIGVAGTPAEGSVTFAPFQVTFSGTPSPAPTAANITVACTDMVGNGQGDCPTIASVAGTGAGPYMITLSTNPAVRECITVTFMGTNAGQKLQYQNLPGDTNLNGTTTGQDVLSLVSAINTATTILARHDINRNGAVTGQDVLREVQLINGGVSVSPPTGYNAATVAACP